MNDSFYDALAPYYHLLYQDWEQSIEKQGSAIGALLRENGVAPGSNVLDAACGIGTQTLGLARQFSMSASDISTGAIARLDRELLARGLAAATGADDLRVLERVAPQSMDAVIACDNSVPHLLTDAEILQCFRQFARCLRPGGLAVISVRDYANIARISPDVRPYGMRYEQGNRFMAIQVWEWEQEHYDLRMYLTREGADGQCTTQCIVSRYFAIEIDRLMSLLEQAGFSDVARRDDVMFQPVLTARCKP